MHLSVYMFPSPRPLPWVEFLNEPNRGYSRMLFAEPEEWGSTHQADVGCWANEELLRREQGIFERANRDISNGDLQHMALFAPPPTGSERRSSHWAAPRRSSSRTRPRRVTFEP